ncbi:MAG: hypothetical protein QXX20_04755 [Candidatus Thermoplasmatota archaeon]
MNKNTTIPLGAIVMIHQIENRHGLFQHLFSDIGINAKDFIPNVKVLVGNKLTHSVSILQIPETYPQEFAQRLGMKEPFEGSNVEPDVGAHRKTFSHYFSAVSTVSQTAWSD